MLKIYLIRTKRPVPVSESTIGSWIKILEFTTYISVLTNSGK